MGRDVRGRIAWRIHMGPTTPIVLAGYSAVAARTYAAPGPQPSVDVEMLLGFVAVLAPLVCFLERRRSPAARFALGVCLLLTAAFGFSKGVWPLGVLQSVWAGITFARWRAMPKGSRAGKTTRQLEMSNRRTELFGSTISNN